MKQLESYHITGFILAYIALHKKFNVKTTPLKITNTLYKLCALSPLILLLAKVESKTMEQLVIVLSYVYGLKALQAIVNINDTPEIKLDWNNYAYSLGVISILMLIYTKLVTTQVGYMLMLSFFILSIWANKISFSDSTNDLVILHLLFFFTK